MNHLAKIIQLPDSDAPTPATDALSAKRRRAGFRGSSQRPADGSGTVTSLTDRLPPEAPLGPRQGPSDRLVRGLTSMARFVRRRIAGDYALDEHGFDAELLDMVFLPAVRPLAEKWFRLQVSGVEHIPRTGGGLVVANHAGTLPLDGVMLQLAVHDHHPEHRILRLLAADLVFELPVLGSLARRAGHTVACRPEAERLLGSGELTGVFPEGYKGVGKNFADRYELQRFGRGGFVAAALRAQVPIIPCAIVGSEEIYPKLADLRPLARVLGLPYFPLTPLFPLLGPLGAIPLPSKWRIEFGEPIRPEQLVGAEDPMTMFAITDQVRETIQNMLYRLLAQRGNPFLG